MVSARAQKQEARAYAERHGLSYAQALSRLRGEQKVAYRRAEVVYFGANFGGAGKTTATLLTAFGLKSTGRKILLVDGDLRDGQLRSLTGQISGYSFRDLGVLLDSGQKITEDSLKGLIHSDPESGLDFLYAPQRSMDAEEGMADDFLQVLPVLRRSYDYILIDSSVDYESSARAFLRAADRVAILTWPSIQGRSRDDWMELSSYDGTPIELRRGLNPEAELSEDGVISLPHIPSLIRNGGIAELFKNGGLTEVAKFYRPFWDGLLRS